MPATSTSRSPQETDELRIALQAETQLRFAAEERLRRKEQELAEFILTAAHDLREPLRTVTAYSELLVKTGENPSDSNHSDSNHSDSNLLHANQSDADRFRRHLLDGSSRIQALLTGMEDFVSASADSRYLLSVDMNEVFREAATHTARKTDLPAMVVTRGALPTVLGDFEKLTRVAQHLLDNAARYCDKPEADIQVLSWLEKAGWLFTVQDNGPGIDSPYRERVFEPFRRLHGREYSGSGLGLSYCRKAIESQGGRIWVDAMSHGKGSAICFTLPAAS